jgi:hypothetical protein
LEGSTEKTNATVTKAGKPTQRFKKYELNRDINTLIKTYVLSTQF